MSNPTYHSYLFSQCRENMENVAFLCSLILYMYRRQFRKVHVLQLESDTSVSVIVLHNHLISQYQSWTTISLDILKIYDFLFKWESTCIFHCVLCFFSRSGTCMVFIFIITLIWEEFWQIMGSKVTHSGRTFHSRVTMRSVDINAEICI